MVEVRTRRADPTGPLVFIVFAVAGVAYIVVSKSLGIGAVLVTLVPVLLMVGYALSIWLFRGLRLRSDQSGDNFYYMGFIFTLTSLAVTLIQFSDGSNAAEIVRNFGVAVASTIAGIVLRIVFNLFRRDPMEVEHEARIELAEAAKSVRIELNNVLFEISHFTRAQQQMLTETLEEYTRRAEASATAFEQLFSNDVHTKAVAAAREELLATAQLLAEVNETLRTVPNGSRRRDRKRLPLWRRFAFWLPSNDSRPKEPKL